MQSSQARAISAALNKERFSQEGEGGLGRLGHAGEANKVRDVDSVIERRLLRPQYSSEVFSYSWWDLKNNAVTLKDCSAVLHNVKH